MGSVVEPLLSSLYGTGLWLVQAVAAGLSTVPECIGKLGNN